MSVDALNLCMPNGIYIGMLEYGPRFTKLFQTGVRFVGQVKESEKTPLLSVLLEGPPGSGKTALAAALVYARMYVCIIRIVCICVRVCVCVYVCRYVCMCVCLYACMHAYMYAYMYIYHTHTHTHIHIGDKGRLPVHQVRVGGNAGEHVRGSPLPEAHPGI